MVAGSNGRFVIRHRPPNKSKGSWYFSIAQAMFVDFKDATVFRTKDIAKAYANEFGVALNKDTDIIDLKDTHDSSSK
jgi:hypothetical protein